MGFKLVTLSNESGLIIDLRENGQVDETRQGFGRQGVKNEANDYPNREWRVGD